MFKRSTFAGLVAVGLLLLFVVAQFVIAQSADTTDEEKANAYFEDIQAAPYTDWAFEPGVPEGFYTGSPPHGLVLRTFINDLVAEAVGSGADVFPEGSIIVKENHITGHDSEGAGDEAAEDGGDRAVKDFEPDLEALTVMVKVAGYNPEVGDWFWAKYAPDGSLLAAGQPAGCIGCHGQVAANDYVYDASLK